jgi:uncharacterized tellurite resistance protein B-like protein
MLRFRVFQWIVCASLWLVHARVAFARAGGGGGYSSGGGGGSSSSSSYSSSSSSGGSGGGDFTAFDAIVLVVMLVVFIAVIRKHKRARAERVEKRRAQSRKWATQLGGEAGAFDLEAFERRVSSAFLKIQEAWSNQDLRAVRGFMSDGLHERFSIQLREQEALGYRNPMSNVRVLEVGLVDAHRLAHFDVVSVRVSAMATDYRREISTGSEIEGSRRTETFTEIWSFLRGRDAGGSEGRGLFEGQCPNCAAPVDPERAWACASCGSELDGAPPDWVLTEITQDGEWSNEERSDANWMKAAIGRDPGLTREQLEDRASVLFWRLMNSYRTGSASELTSSSRPEFLDLHRRRVEGGSSRYVGDCAVGAVRLRGILSGEHWDLALIEIRWSGGVFVRASQGGVERGEATGGRKLSRHLLVMARRAGVESHVGRCIVSAHCVSCGAPDQGALDGQCRFCDEPLNDGRDWLLDRFVDLGSSEARSLLADLERPKLGIATDTVEEAELESELAASDMSPGSLELFGWVLTVAYADQNITRRELASIERLATRLGIVSSTARALRRAAQFGRLEVATPSDASQGRAWLRSLAHMARADGRIDRRERATLARLARRVGLEGVDLLADSSAGDAF